MKARPSARSGAIIINAAFLMLILIGMVAFALDLGYVALTKTQLQAACDAAALAAGTELSAGFRDTSTPAQVAAAAKARAVEYAALNRNGDLAGSYADPERDVLLRTAWFDPFQRRWVMSAPGVIQNYKSYNAVTVQLLRNQEGSANGDAPLNLFFGPLLGVPQSELRVQATAIIMPSDNSGGANYPLRLIE